MCDQVTPRETFNFCYRCILLDAKSDEIARFDLPLVHKGGKHLQALGGDGCQEAHHVLDRDAVLDRQDRGERVATYPQVATLGNPIGVEQVRAGVEVVEEELGRLLLCHRDAGVGEEVSGPALDRDGVAASQDALWGIPAFKGLGRFPAHPQGF